MSYKGVILTWFIWIDADSAEIVLILTRPDSLSLTLFLKIPVGGSFKRIEIFFWTFICLSSNSTIMLLCALSNMTKKLKLKPTNKRVSADAWKWNRTKRKNWLKNKQNPVFLARSETQAFANMNDSFHSIAAAIMVILKIYLIQKCLFDSLLVRISLLAPKMLLDYLCPMITIPIPSHPIHYPKIEKILPWNSIFCLSILCQLYAKRSFQICNNFVELSFDYCLSPVSKMFYQCYGAEKESKGNQEWGGFLSRPNDSTRKSLRQGCFLFRNSLGQGYFLFSKVAFLF